MCMNIGSSKWYVDCFKRDMKRKKFKKPEQLLELYLEERETEFAEWEQLIEYGCSDPSWPDGSNLNLVRNHISYYNDLIRKLCECYGLEVPDCCDEPVPPKVDNGYMANLNPTDEYQINRIARLKSQGAKLTSEKPVWKRLAKAAEPVQEFLAESMESDQFCFAW